MKPLTKGIPEGPLALTKGPDPYLRVVPHGHQDPDCQFQGLVLSDVRHLAFLALPWGLNAVLQPIDLWGRKRTAGYSLGEGEKGRVFSGEGENGRSSSEEVQNERLFSGEGENGKLFSVEGENGMLFSGGGRKREDILWGGKNGRLFSREGENGRIFSGEGENGTLFSGVTTMGHQEHKFLLPFSIIFEATENEENYCQMPIEYLPYLIAKKVNSLFRITS